MLKQFFILCSGADQSILKSCSNGEQNKYAGIGATVFFTALMASIAAGFALQMVFNNLVSAIFFGIIWGLLIFNLDRFIVSTLKKRQSFLNEFLQVIPRLLLALIIAIVISKPLELKIFEKEINQVLLTQKNALTLANQDQIANQFNPEIEALNSEIGILKSEVDTKSAEVNTLYNTYITEAEGTSGTNKLGKGPVYKEKRDKHDAALAALQDLKIKNSDKITTLETKIETLKSTYNTQVAKTQPIIDNFDGIMARITALGTLPWLPSFFIFLLFLAIETAPIFSKLLSPKGAYDYKLENEESAIKSWVDQQIYERERIVSTNATVNDKVYTDMANEDEFYKFKKQKTRELMQFQADAFYKKQKTFL
ncbi:DUF4407 domain-containing protein [Formosa algae]|uniref:Archaellum component FlaC n=1 Tax=Formosa algae TaxID=225843 RepID=A0A9X0YIM7_9FLAO|nr:DUF4407 domain-containing protein [Formosa algae]MBP1839141.1 archaellum component FlaC [Formosa algae]MDQ0333918.1 archaellum component FlaC [Formosa algae]OEI79656.1 hypothetical protein AST99_12945 [Formosa algae]